MAPFGRVYGQLSPYCEGDLYPKHYQGFLNVTPVLVQQQRKISQMSNQTRRNSDYISLCS